LQKYNKSQRTAAVVSTEASPETKTPKKEKKKLCKAENDEGKDWK